MSRPFQGVVNIDIWDSVPDWAPYMQPVAPKGAPNVLYIVLDDVGFSAMAPWGGLIETPNIDRLAENGLTYTNWHTTALCSPTRSSLRHQFAHATDLVPTIYDCIGWSCRMWSKGFPQIPLEGVRIRALPHRPGPYRDPRPRGRASGEAAGADQPLVPQGWPVPGPAPDYPGTNPFPFTGGTIAKAIVDVSGEPFIDLEKEAIAMMARE